MMPFVFLALSVGLSVLLGFIFKAFPRFGVNTFNAIVVNYWICVVVGSLSLGEVPLAAGFWEAAWFPYALGLGLLFITGFNLVGLTVAQLGVTVSAVAQKMSLALSAVAAILLYGESRNVGKLAGILLALLAVLLSNWPRQSSPPKAQAPAQPRWALLLPLAVLLVSSSIEVLLQYVELRVPGGGGSVAFLIFLFGTAGSIGALLLAYLLLSGRTRFTRRDLWGGIVLGVPNFGSIYFLVRLLGSGWEGSVVFPVNNVLIIGMSALLAYWLLKEQLSRLNWLGVALAMASVLLIGLS